MTRFAAVTGAGSGIGRACAHALMADGWTVALLGRQPETLQETLHLGGTEPGGSRVLPCDVSDPLQVQAVFDQVHEHFGRLDLLFNNAGSFAPFALPGDVRTDDWQRVVGVNLNGAFYCLSQAFRLMQTQSPQGGRIINNGSVSAHVPRPGSVAYAATKHAVTGMTRAAALDGRAHQIAVGQIDIGNVESDMTASMKTGMRQADGTVRPEACMDMDAVVQTFMGMVRLPLTTNVLFTTVMATQMPYVGRG